MRYLTWLAAAMAFASTACADATFSAQIVPYNHTGDYIDAVYVNGTWGGNVHPHSGGGSFVCCVDLPLRPPKDFTVTVKWDDKESKIQERVVKIPAYSKAGQVNVHFLRGGEIKVFVVDFGLRHPEYPLKGEEAQLRTDRPNSEPKWAR